MVSHQRSHCQLNLPRNTPKEQKSGARDFSVNVVNIHPPNLPNSLFLPGDTPLPELSSFRFSSASPNEVMLLARQNPGG